MASDETDATHNETIALPAGLNTESRLFGYLKYFDQHLERTLLVILYIYMVLVICISVLSRYILGYTPIWGNETAIFMYIYLSWIGASWAIRKRAHIRIDMLQRFLSYRATSVTYIIGDLALLGFIFYVGQGFLPLWQRTMEFGTVVQSLRVSQIYFLFAIPVGFALMTARTLQMLYIDLHNLRHDKPPFEGAGLMEDE